MAYGLGQSLMTLTKPLVSIDFITVGPPGAVCHWNIQHRAWEMGDVWPALSWQWESELVEWEGPEEHLESFTCWYYFWCTADDLTVSVKKLKT